MYGAHDYLTSQSILRTACDQGLEERQVFRSALKLWDHTRARGWLYRASSILTRRNSRLLSLGEVGENCTIQNRHYAGIQNVPLRQIRGSAGRCHDFDAGFHPRQSRTKERWLSIAVAHNMGITLPPVALIQVGNIYFVQDGHHRISVARAKGQDSIESEVVVWQSGGTRARPVAQNTAHLAATA